MLVWKTNNTFFGGNRIEHTNVNAVNVFTQLDKYGVTQPTKEIILCPDQ